MPNLDAANITFNALKIVAGAGRHGRPDPARRRQAGAHPDPDQHRPPHRQHDRAHRRRRRQPAPGLSQPRRQSDGSTDHHGRAPPAHHKPWYQHLYVQVLCAIVLGVLLGHFYPSIGAQMKPLGDAFIKLIKMLIAPIIFCTVVHGIASMEDMKKVGRVGIKALIYFEVMTTIALIIGLVVVNLWQPGVGMNVDPDALDTKAIATYTAKAGEQSTVEFLLHIIPATVVGAFAEGEILQVLFFAILFAFALHWLGERGKPLLRIIDQTAHVFFGIVGIVMKVAPIGAFGAMAFTIGKYGVGTLRVAGLADARLLRHLPDLRLRRAGRRRLAVRLQHLQVHPLHQGGAADRARHQLLGIGAAAHARQDGEPGRRQVGGRPGDPDRLLVQPRRHLHLSDHGGGVPGPGDQHRPHASARSWA